MLDLKFGFIGCGNMGSAMLRGICRSNLTAPENILVSDKNHNMLSALSEELGIGAAKDNIEAARFADYLFLAVKPNIIPDVIKEIKSSVKDSEVIVSIAAGVSISRIEELFSKTIRLVRVMPNTPALVGEGMSALSLNSEVSDEESEVLKSVFSSFGKCEIVPESLMDAVVGVSGSSPAYVYMFIEAMADAAVLDGMPRQAAYKFAAQSVLGAAKMVLESGKHPGELKDAVCSPGGTTIKAVSVLEEKGLRSAVISAQTACSEVSRQMSHKS